MSEIAGNNAKLLALAWVLLALVAGGIIWYAMSENDGDALYLVVVVAFMAAGAYNRLK